MISMVVFLLFLGLIVFGPKKTIELAQESGRMLAQVKRAAGQFQESAMESTATHESGAHTPKQHPGSEQRRSPMPPSEGAADVGTSL